MHNSKVAVSKRWRYQQTMRTNCVVIGVLGPVAVRTVGCVTRAMFVVPGVHARQAVDCFDVPEKKQQNNFDG